MNITESERLRTLQSAMEFGREAAPLVRGMLEKADPDAADALDGLEDFLEEAQRFREPDKVTGEDARRLALKADALMEAFRKRRGLKPKGEADPAPPEETEESDDVSDEEESAEVEDAASRLSKHAASAFLGFVPRRGRRTGMVVPARKG